MGNKTSTWLMLVSWGVYAGCGSGAAMEPMSSGSQVGAGQPPAAAAGTTAAPSGVAGKDAGTSEGAIGMAGASSTAGKNAAAPSGGGGAPASTPGDAPSISAGAGAGGSPSSAGAAAGGTLAVAGSGGMMMGPIAGAEPPAQMDYGKGDGSDVITIGDSWMNIATNGGGIQGALDRAGTKYRHYAQPGTTLIMGQIPVEYDQAKAANPKISTIIMTGGGNDVMFSGGCNTKEACAMSAQRIADALDDLWTKAAADGVTSTVYIQYSRNAGTAPADTRPDKAPIPKICTTGKLRCITIDTTDLIASTDTVDGIHPTVAGCDRIAKRTLETMEKNGVRR